MAAPLPQSADQPGLNGVLSVLKPAGATSTAVISYIKHILSPRAVGAPVAKGRRSQVKVGHGGTLDKLARGVLVVGIGTGTKQLPTYLASEKLYLARGQLGVETETHDLDPTGKVVWNDRDYCQKRTCSTATSRRARIRHMDCGSIFMRVSCALSLLCFFSAS